MLKKQPTFGEILADIRPSTGGRTCMTCLLPKELLGQVHEARRAGRGTADISKALEIVGHPIRPAALSNHFRNGHVKD
jgi:hypothetical protein